MSAEQRIEVGKLSDGVGVRVAGPGSVRQAALIYRVAVAARERQSPRFEADLADCCSIDSTFLGCLLRIYKESRGAGVEFLIAAPSPAVMRTIQSSGLESILPIGDRSSSAEDWRSLELPGWQDDDVRNVALSSHESLSEIDERNRRIFEPVVEQLRRELKRDQ